MDKHTTRLKANNKGERDILITALVNSGYTVRLVEVKTDGKREKLVEYWETNEQIAKQYGIELTEKE